MERVPLIYIVYVCFLYRFVYASICIAYVYVYISFLKSRSIAGPLIDFLSLLDYWAGREKFSDPSPSLCPHFFRQAFLVSRLAIILGILVCYVLSLLPSEV